ncbi:hypothetical protein B0G77_5470 [Paraburkholderia sp. BL10I2N1]|nr:hypothetical protein B0G77_5470 [Paraburkholderia sp. BL10I2N1]
MYEGATGHVVPRTALWPTVPRAVLPPGNIAPPGNTGIPTIPFSVLPDGRSLALIR